MMHFSKQFRGYNKSQVDVLLDEKENQIRLLNDRISKLQDDYEQLKKQKDLLQHRVNIQEQTNEEIARLALKEASELIDKAKKNANMILSESLEYVRSLSGEMSDFKAQAVRFRASVEKMSKDILESIDKSEVYNLMNEESKNEKYDEGDSL
ncbi:DivIVA domain-containing protein [[Clostridium] spiroforme]|nr:DivIVA domain-containing protein [Thomasclavelia spiroformis]